MKGQNSHYWICKDCSWTGDSPNLNGPIMHETATGHKTEPTNKTAEAWKGLI